MAKRRMVEHKYHIHEGRTVLEAQAVEHSARAKTRIAIGGLVIGADLAVEHFVGLPEAAQMVLLGGGGAYVLSAIEHSVAAIRSRAESQQYPEMR